MSECVEPAGDRDPGLPWLRADLNWARMIVPPCSQNRAALFLDRDGVIVAEREYLGNPDGVELLPGVASAIRTAGAAGAAVVIVTNQSGIGRGYFGWKDYAAVENRMLELLAAEGAAVDLILACPHHPAGRPPYDRQHGWRKPGSGMLLEARDLLHLSFDRSLLIGDRASDIEAACNAGLNRAILVMTGHGAGEVDAALALARPGFAVGICRSVGDTIAEAVNWLAREA